MQGLSDAFRNDDSIIFCKDGKYGLSDLLGNYIVEPQYEEMRFFDNKNGEIIFCQDGKAGVMDRKGNILIPPTYEYICPREWNGKYYAELNGKYGFLNDSFDVAIPFQFDEVRLDFYYYESERTKRARGMCCIVQVGEKYGIINEKGQFIVAPTYDSIYYPSTVEESSYFIINSNGKEGLIDKTGNVVLWPDYDCILVNSDYIGIRKGNYYGAMNMDLEWICYGEYDWVGYEWDYNLIFADDMSGITHYFDMNGNELIYGSSISDDGLITVSEGDGYSLYDTEGRYVRYLDYYNVSKFSNGLSRTRSEDYNYGFINEDGNVVISFEFDDAGHFSEDGLVSVYKDGKWAFMNESGELITDFIFDGVGDFSYGRAAVCRDGKWGYINAIGEEVIPVQFDSAEDFTRGAVVGVTIGTGEDTVEYTINFAGDIID